MIMKSLAEIAVERIAAARAPSPPEAKPEGLLVYQLRITRDSGFTSLDRQLVSEFLGRHGIALPGGSAFMDDGLIEIFQQVDGFDDEYFDVYVWQAAGDIQVSPACSTCPDYVQPQRIRVPLRGSAPLVSGVTIWGEDLPLEMLQEEQQPASAPVDWQRIEQPDGTRNLPPNYMMVWVYNGITSTVGIGYTKSGLTDAEITHWASLQPPDAPAVDDPDVGG